MLHICATAQGTTEKRQTSKSCSWFDYRVAAHFNDMKHQQHHYNVVPLNMFQYLQQGKPWLIIEERHSGYSPYRRCHLKDWIMNLFSVLCSSFYMILFFSIHDSDFYKRFLISSNLWMFSECLTDIDGPVLRGATDDRQLQKRVCKAEWDPQQMDFNLLASN